MQAWGMSRTKKPNIAPIRTPHAGVGYVFLPIAARANGPAAGWDSESSSPCYWPDRALPRNGELLFSYETSAIPVPVKQAGQSESGSCELPENFYSFTISVQEAVMYHPRLMGKPYSMGQKMGKIFRRAKVQFPIRLDGFQRAFGKESGRLLKTHFPEAAEEIRGVTDVTGDDHELFTSWMMCMGCCLYTAEDDCVEVRGCTAFSFTRSGHVYYGRDNDLPPYLGKVSKSVYYRPENKNAFILNTSSFINGEEGINQHRLAVAMTFVLPKIAEIRPGLNSVFLVRYILENCENVREGIQALERLPIASSCNILLADRQGEMVVVECNPLQMNIRRAEKNRQGEPFIITVNHFTSEEMRAHDASDHNAYFSETRYQTAFEALKNPDGVDAIVHAQDILSGKRGFMCQYAKEMDFDTVWSSVFDINSLRVYRAEGNPARTMFIEDKRLSA